MLVSALICLLVLLREKNARIAAIEANEDLPPIESSVDNEIAGVLSGDPREATRSVAQSAEAVSPEYGGKLLIRSSRETVLYQGEASVLFDGDLVVPCRSGFFRFFFQGEAPIASSVRIGEVKYPVACRMSVGLENAVTIDIDDGIQLFVTSSLSGRALNEVEVYLRTSGRDELMDILSDERYGEIGPPPDKVLLAVGSSPLSISADSLPAEYWVTSRGYEWYCLDAKQLQKEYHVVLDPASSLSIACSGLPETHSGLVGVYEWNARAFRFSSTMATSVAAQETCEVVGVPPGRYLVTLETRRGGTMQVVDAEEVVIEDPALSYSLVLDSEPMVVGSALFDFSGELPAHEQEVRLTPLGVHGMRANAKRRLSIQADSKRSFGPYEMPAGDYLLHISPIGIVRSFHVEAAVTTSVRVALEPAIDREITVYSPDGEKADVSSVLWCAALPQESASLYGHEFIDAPSNPILLSAVPGPLRLFVSAPGYGVQGFWVNAKSESVSLRAVSVIKVSFDGTTEVPSISLVENIRFVDRGGASVEPLDYSVSGELGGVNVEADILFDHQGPLAVALPSLLCCGTIPPVFVELRLGVVTELVLDSDGILRVEQR